MGRSKAAPVRRRHRSSAPYRIGGAATAFLRDRLLCCGLSLLLIIRLGLAVAPTAHLIGLRALAPILALDSRLGDLLGDQPNTSDRVVVGWDHEIDHVM